MDKCNKQWLKIIYIYESNIQCSNITYIYNIYIYIYMSNVKYVLFVCACMSNDILYDYKRQ